MAAGFRMSALTRQRRRAPAGAAVQGRVRPRARPLPPRRHRLRRCPWPAGPSGPFRRRTCGACACRRRRRRASRCPCCLPVSSFSSSLVSVSVLRPRVAVLVLRARAEPRRRSRQERLQALVRASHPSPRSRRLTRARLGLRPPSCACATWTPSTHPPRGPRQVSHPCSSWTLTFSTSCPRSRP